MNINLKQPEIETALRQYIGRKLDLRNSTLAIMFNMGRGDNGLSANLTIEDVEIPGFTDVADPDEPILVLSAAGPSAAAKAMTAGGLLSDAIDAGSKVGADSAQVVDLPAVEVIVIVETAATEVVETAAAPVVEEPAEVEIPGSDAPLEAVQEAEVVQAAPAAEIETAEALVTTQAKPTTSLFG